MIICSYVVFALNVNMFFQVRPTILLAALLLLLLKTGRESSRDNGGSLSFGQGFKNMYVTGAIGILMCTLFEGVLYSQSAELVEIKKEIDMKGMEATMDFFSDNFPGVMSDEVLDEAEDQIENANPAGLDTTFRTFMTRLFTLVIPVFFLSLLMKRSLPGGGGNERDPADRKRYVIKDDSE